MPRVYFECKVCCYGVSASYEDQLYTKIDKHYDETGHTMQLVSEEE